MQGSTSILQLIDSNRQRNSTQSLLAAATVSSAKRNNHQQALESVDQSAMMTLEGPLSHDSAVSVGTLHTSSHSNSNSSCLPEFPVVISTNDASSSSPISTVQLNKSYKETSSATTVEIKVVSSTAFRETMVPENLVGVTATVANKENESPQNYSAYSTTPPNVPLKLKLKLSTESEIGQDVNRSGQARIENFTAQKLVVSRISPMDCDDRKIDVHRHQDGKSNVIGEYFDDNHRELFSRLDSCRNGSDPLPTCNSPDMVREGVIALARNTDSAELQSVGKLSQQLIFAVHQQDKRKLQEEDPIENRISNKQKKQKRHNIVGQSSILSFFSK